MIASKMTLLGFANPYFRRSAVGTRTCQHLVHQSSLDSFEPRSMNALEIMVNGPSTIFVERHGQLRRISLQFSSEQSLRQVAERIASQVGRRLDLAAPTLDARLQDGSRVNLVLPPLATQGTHITIRKFSRRMRSLSDLVSSGGASPALASFLAWAVQNRLNLLVVGGTGSGKTTLLNMLASEIPHDQRVITIEDAAELQFDHPHCVTLEARAAGHEGSGCITIRDLLRNALSLLCKRTDRSRGWSIPDAGSFST
ncbi:MAG: CpaF family protein [Betaproteobacteria bacterium]|nr:CpaF family protein [Betaproteobacteria bacterium]